MITLITADLHWSDNPRDSYRHQIVDWLIKKIRERKATRLIMLGDFTVEKNYHDAALVNMIVDHIVRLSKEVDVWALMANHDYTNPTSPFFAFIQHLKDVHWIDKVETAGNDLFLPHTNDWAAAWEGLDFRAYETIYTHQTFQGAILGQTDVGIPLYALENATRVISGDVHTPMKIPLPSGGWLHYVGSPYRVNFGDSYEPRILQIDDNNKLTSIVTPGMRKQLLDITSADVKTLDDLADRLQFADGDVIKIRYHLRRSDYDDWPKTREKIRRWATESNMFVVDSIRPVLTDVAHKITRQKTYANDEELLRTYGQRVGLSKECLEAGLKLMEQA